MQRSEVEKLAKELGSAVDDIRDAAFQRLPAFLSQQELYNCTDILKLWKGLFYGLWNLDGDSNQLECAEKLAACLLDENITEEVRAAYWKGCLVTLRSEWIYIDQHRLDKYYALARRMLNAILRLAIRSNWLCLGYFADLETEIMAYRGISSGLPSHFAEIFTEELQKAMVAEDMKELTSRAFVCCIFPFVLAVTTSSTSTTLKKKIESVVFEVLKKENNHRKSFLEAITLLGIQEWMDVEKATPPFDPSAVEAKQKLCGNTALAPLLKKRKEQEETTKKRPIRKKRRNRNKT